MTSSLWRYAAKTSKRVYLANCIILFRQILMGLQGISKAGSHAGLGNIDEIKDRTMASSLPWGILGRNDFLPRRIGVTDNFIVSWTGEALFRKLD